MLQALLTLLDEHRLNVVMSTQRTQQCKNHAAECGWHGCLLARLASEADACIEWLEVIGQIGLLGDFLCELHDVDTQAIWRIQPRVDVPDVGDREESTDLNGNCL